MSVITFFWILQFKSNINKSIFLKKIKETGFETFSCYKVMTDVITRSFFFEPSKSALVLTKRPLYDLPLALSTGNKAVSPVSIIPLLRAHGQLCFPSILLN
jgi:hypothetical protein